MKGVTGVEPFLEVRGLTKNFDIGGRALHAVDHISFTLAQGRTLGVVGESGCGKSTLGKIIVGLQSATDGQVLFKGRDITHADRRRRKELRREMQIIFQDPMSSLDPRLCTADLIAEPLSIYKVCPDRACREARVRELMDLVGISRHMMYAYPHELDGGRRQRIGIARALALDPEFVVCDEPVSALDVSIQAQVLNLMMDLQEQMGLTYLFITHNLSVVKHISDEIAVMYLGHIVELAGKDDLFSHPSHPYTQALLSAIPQPDPKMEKTKTLEIYDPSIHHYETDKPSWVEIRQQHYIFCNQQELEYYRKKLQTQ